MRFTVLFPLLITLRSATLINPSDLVAETISTLEAVSFVPFQAAVNTFSGDRYSFETVRLQATELSLRAVDILLLADSIDPATPETTVSSAMTLVTAKVRAFRSLLVSFVSGLEAYKYKRMRRYSRHQAILDIAGACRVLMAAFVRLAEALHATAPAVLIDDAVNSAYTEIDEIETYFKNLPLWAIIAIVVACLVIVCLALVFGKKVRR